MNEDNQAAVSQDALEKALTSLSNLAKSTADEKQVLLQKAMSAELSADENARLMQLMGGKGEAESTLAKSATAPLQPSASPAVQAAVDVSEYLNAFHAGALGALETLSDSIEKSNNSQHEFNVTLAKAIVQLGTLVKSLDSRLENWGGAQVESPRAALHKGQAQASKALQKSFGGASEAYGEDHIQKGEILALLEDMHVESLRKGMGGMATCGEDLNKSIAKYEQTGRMSRPLVEEMKAFRAKRGA